MRLIKEAQLGNSHATGSDPAGDEHGTKAGFRDRTRAATASTRAPGIPPNRLCACKSAAACKTTLSTCVPRKTGHPFATARWPANTGRHGLREEGMAWVRLLTRGSSGVKPRQGDVGAVAAWRGAGRGGGHVKARVLVSNSCPASWLSPVAARDGAAATVRPSHRQGMEPSRRQRLQPQLSRVALEVGTRPPMRRPPSSRSSSSPRSPLPPPLLPRWEKIGGKIPWRRRRAGPEQGTAGQFIQAN
jgi:hypothetical protein